MSLRKSILLSAFVIVSLIAAVDTGFGQSFQGGIRGAITDPGGALVPGVEITLANEATNVSRSTVSNETGQYVFSAVAPGTYKLRAVLPGFKTYDRAGLNIGTQQFIALDIQLEVGAVTDEISVVADAPLIETSTASNSSSLPNLLLSTLPNTGRNAFMIALTVPTVTHAGDPQYNRQQDQTNATAVSMAGGPVRGNNYLLDGVPITDLRNRAVIFPNIESIAEVKVQVNTYDAEMGRTGGGVFNTTMKSGSNDWHGEGHIQQRPQPWAARNFFDTVKPDFKYWLYGGAFGGPIRKDKTFFFVTTEGYRTGTPRSLRMTVPTKEMKLGDFSAAGINVYDPLTTRADPNNPGQFIRDQFPGNRIPANRLNPVGAALMQFYPDPNGPGLVNNYTKGDVLHDKADQITGKIDHTFNQKHSISGTYAWYHSREPFQVFFRGTPGEIADLNNYYLFRTVQAPIVNYTWTPDPTSVVTLRYGYNSFRDDCIPTSAGYDLSKLGFDSGFVSSAQTKQFPSFSFDDYRQLGGQPNYLIKWKSQNLLGNYSKFIGRHNVRFGGSYREMGVNFSDYSEAAGVFSFDKVFTQQNPNRAVANQGNAIASLLLGNPASARLTTAVPLRFYTRYYAGYVQDDFRLTSKLTFNAGLRYEFETDMRERDDHLIVGFDRTATNPAASKVADAAIRDRVKGGLMYAGVNGNKKHQGDPQKLSFQPRLGIAYTVNKGTVVRAGYGLFFSPLQLFFPGSGSYGALGFTASTSPLASTDGNLTPALRMNNPFPNGVQKPTGNTLGLLQNVGDVVRFIDQNNKRGYVQQYSFDIQHEMPGGIALTMGYVGSRLLHMSAGVINSSTLNINQLPISALSLGTGLQTPVPNPFFGISEFGALSRSATIARGQLLRPYPQFQDVLMVRPSIGSGYYNGLTLKAERRTDSRGIGLRVNYTFSKALDDYFGDSSFFAQRSGVALDNYNTRREYGLSVNDVRHRFTSTPTWDLPIGKGRHWVNGGVGDKIIGGWNLSPVITLQGGLPAAIWQNNNNAGTLGGTQRPNLVSGVDPCSSGDKGSRLNHWFNDGLGGRPAAFTQADPFTLGSTPRTINCRVANQYNFDLAIRKSISITEKSRIAFRLEIINATNTAKFRAPESRFGRGTFGTISEQAGFPRLIQYMIRYER